MKFYGNKITKKMAIEIFGENKSVTQCKSENGKNIVLIGYGFEDIEKKWPIYSAKTHKYISTAITKKITTLKNAKGAMYVAD